VCTFSTLIIWKLHFKVQISFETQNFVLFLSLSLPSSSPTFKLLSMASYGGELLLDSSSPWSGVSNHLSSFSIPLSLIFKKQRTPLMKKIQDLQALHGATSSVLRCYETCKTWRTCTKCDYMMWQWGVANKCSPPPLKFNWIGLLSIQLNLFPDAHIKYSLNAYKITKLSLIQKLV